MKYILSLFSLCSGLYLPGVVPKQYLNNDTIELKVNKLSSAKTQIPYAYYTLPFCEPKGGIKTSPESMGEILLGDEIENADYELKMMKNVNCQVLCKKNMTAVEKNLFKQMIADEYQASMMVDNLPAATRYVNKRKETGTESYTYMNGFPVGSLKNGHYYVHNHLRLILSYHQNPEKFEGARIVGVEIEPHSVLFKENKDDSTINCKNASVRPPMELFGSQEEITFTYDVLWYKSDVAWASRWDNYLKAGHMGGQVHWFSILNSLMIVIFLTAMVAMILLRTLHRDIAKYNQVATSEDIQEETGWKLVHGDVFRKPIYSTLLSVCVGTGSQFLAMAIIIINCAAIGFVTPARRGGLLQTMLLLVTFMGFLSGYVSARLYKFFRGEHWKRVTLFTSLLFPGLFFCIFFVLNLGIWAKGSSGAVPFATLFALLVLWFGISVPLVFLGAYFGFRKEAIEAPVRVNTIPREIPTQPWFVQPLFSSLIGGVLPFGAVFTELFFILSSIWQHQVYYLFGFLVLVLLILIVTSAEISIAFTYFQLASEDYRWWWRSFAASGSSALYVFLYSCLYFQTRLQIEQFVGILLYFGYTFIISVSFMLVTGTVGMLSTFMFVKAIYGSVKID
eukprot:GEMP01011597.1.p1 GENE.GEMP01011597.1~~GEMP01011597.1.p1  ORF type:complete len:620 (+),score=43.51 GEMP01011597.1:85-1944(+)